MDDEVRRVAQGAKSVAGALGQLRNDRGTGHGRALPPAVEQEHALTDRDRRPLLWCRWAVRRLEFYMVGDVDVIVSMLQDSWFRRGLLTVLLNVANLDRAWCPKMRIGLA